MQLESAPTFRRSQLVFPAVIVAVAIGLYFWGAGVEAEEERQLNAQAQKLVDAMNHPDRLAGLLAGEDAIIDELIPRLPALMAASTGGKASFEVGEIAEDSGATHTLTIKVDGEALLRLHIIHPGPTEQMDVTGFEIPPR